MTAERRPGNDSSTRRNSGGTLALVVAALFVIVLIGIGAFYMMKMFGGARELQALTDSGTLNIAKQQITLGTKLNTNSQQITLQFMNYQYQPDGSNWQLELLYMPNVTWKDPTSAPVTLTAGIEGTNFPYLADTKGQITLQNYNRVMAQTMLVGLNAQAEGTIPAIANAQALYDAVQRDTNSISGRLVTTLSDPTAPSSFFLNTGLANSLRMLGPSSVPSFVTPNYGVAYTSANSPTNVWIDSSILPSGVTIPPAALTSVNSSTNQPYMAGYSNIDTGPFALMATPVFPKQQPHLISLRDFHQSTVSPATLGFVAPNSFAATGSAPVNMMQKPLNVDSAAVIGVLDKEYPASIPNGYLTIQQVTGTPNNTLLPVFLSVNNIDPAQAQTIMNNLNQRLREIAPQYTVAQAQAFLNTVVVPSGFDMPVFLYLYPDLTNPRFATWHQQVAQSGFPDGTPGKLFWSPVPPPQFPLVDPATAPSSEINRIGMYPDGPLTMYIGNGPFYCDWMPSSGFNGFLGMLIIP